MSTLADIPIRVVNRAESDGGNAIALLHEIEALLAHYLAGGEPGLIDLRGLPLSPQDYEALQTLLGTGEVTAHLDAGGPSEIRETAYPGVWWITHRGPDDAVVAELIEIAAIPHILMSQAQDMRTGLARLRRAMSEGGRA
jgi:hydrogenase-1 operon protein HyaF